MQSTCVARLGPKVPVPARRAWPRVARVALAALALALFPTVGWSADDPRDAAFLSPLLQDALETARTNVEVPWFNPATGNGGQIVVERTFYRDPGTPCRAYARTLERSAAAPEVVEGIGCRAGTGRWILEEEPATLARPADPAAPPAPGSPAAEAPAPAVAAAEPDSGPTCPDTVLVPMPSARPPQLAYTMPSRAEL